MPIFSSGRDHYPILHRQNGIPFHRHIYSDLAAYRSQGAIVREAASDEPAPAGGRWITADYEISLEIMQRTADFRADVIVPAMWLVLGNGLLFAEGQRHAELRRALRTLFTSDRLLAWEQRILGPVAHALIDRFACRGSGDLVADFTSAFPHNVLARLLGFSAEQSDEARRCGVEMLCAPTDLGLALRASERITRIFRAMVAERRAAPTSDLTSDIIHLESEGISFTEEDQLCFLRLLAPAGTETTAYAMTNLLMGLLSSPEQLSAIRADRSLIPRAVEEALRWETPVLRTLRRTVYPVSIGGVDLPANAWITVSLGGADRDERAFPEADRFNIFRPQTPQLAFGLGARQCLGAGLARLELRVGLEALLDRLPGLALDRRAAAPFVSGFMFRTALSLPAVWDA